MTKGLKYYVMGENVFRNLPFNFVIYLSLALYLMEFDLAGIKQCYSFNPSLLISLSSSVAMSSQSRDQVNIELLTETLSQKALLDFLKGADIFVPPMSFVVGFDKAYLQNFLNIKHWENL
jgi:hypothetical protein